ncbi:MAG: acyl-CoA dehydrogenase, partial [Ilumatobacteraceae bacterium]
MTVTPDLQTAADVIDLAARAVGKGVRNLAAIGGPDRHQVLAYDIAHAASAVETARSLLDYGGKGEHEGLITCAFAADMAHDLMGKLLGREELWGLEPGALDVALPFVRTFRDPEFVAS